MDTAILNPWKSRLKCAPWHISWLTGMLKLSTKLQLAFMHYSVIESEGKKREIGTCIIFRGQSHFYISLVKQLTALRLVVI